MSELRWILIAIGAVVVVLVYLWGRRTTAATPAAAAEAERRAPDLGDVESGVAAAPSDTAERASPQLHAVAEPPLAHATDDTVSAEPAVVTTVDEAPMPAADKVVTLYLVSDEAHEFPASELIAALRAEGLRFGRLKVFHRYLDPESPAGTQPQFSVANMLKPGTFELDQLRDGTLRGVSLFLQLPGPEDGVAAFADMLATGRRLAVTLGGKLVDVQGCGVTRQSAEHTREEIINFLHAARLSGGQESRGEA